MFQKIRRTCSDVKYFDGCLNRCNPSREQIMLMNSIHHWKFFCSAVSNSNARGVRDYVHCERTHLRRASLNCSPINIRDLNTTSIEGLSQFCEHFDRYQKCFHRERPECTPSAIELKQRIEVALQQTYEKLVSTNHLSVPNLCSQWRRAMPSDIVAPDAVETSTVMMTSSSASSSLPSSTTSSPPVTFTIAAIDYVVEEARKSPSHTTSQMTLPVQMTEAPVVTLNVPHPPARGSIAPKETSRTRSVYDTLTGPMTSSSTNMPSHLLIIIFFLL
ncbi:hypothetical protein PENTCL1PPCAC_26017 [Pristionchus entomophagus]|uniref:Chondroitin proteoglycan 4 domain-containing protein n=1 Tax=Pristionchus entomophagus TaxID=358040 RepID=A0AAV5UAZ5_9BILA|nr:hypothetical protein PENTCL1PPCAC_26017 [Pristionchus entomophagus]